MEIPNHIAIILDGNGRWAKKQNKARTYGHKIGMQNIDEIAKEASNQGIKYLSVFTFSTENWNRSSDEINFLMTMPEIMFNENRIEFYKRNNIKIIWIGRKNIMPRETISFLEKAMFETKNCDGMILTILMDYGSQWEIDTALKVNSIKSYEELRAKMSTNFLPNVDLLIRTGQEKRLSNFLLLQSSYAELLFLDVFWPEFTNQNLIDSIEDYSKRNRRFGGVINEKN
ncbi:polyprenyl diphosphate synthase [Spiroplasma endosymbiont of Labia minor]|uniref:polyprenyl diphosphate synthase n=1 Tax=Spiroplasma endosymbiont of Labia minor TaxID=3066305 RepID=UPI0030D57931